jgi:hypothetical protein
MFKTLSGLTDNAFLRVSADTKTCGSPLNLAPTGGPCTTQSTGSVLYQISNKSQEEKAEKLATERALDKYKFFVFGLTIATTLY